MNPDLATTLTILALGILWTLIVRAALGREISRKD